jgi:hypothetical protein
MAAPWEPIFLFISQCELAHCPPSSCVSGYSLLRHGEVLIWCDPLASLTIVMVIAYGKLLDTARWSQKKRAWIAFAFWAIPQAACFVWIGIEYSRFGSNPVDALDYKLYVFPRLWA